MAGVTRGRPRSATTCTSERGSTDGEGELIKIMASTGREYYLPPPELTCRDQLPSELIEASGVGVDGLGAASERRGNTFKGFNDFYLRNTKARIWP